VAENIVPMTFIRENVARVGKFFFHLFDVDCN
jgi:hypothetical protein